MTRTDGRNIIITEGDFGIGIPITIVGSNILPDHKLKMTIKSDENKDLIIKEYNNIKNNTFEFELTEEESKKLIVNSYFYVLDWYKDGEFLCNVIKDGCLVVEDKK